MKFYAPIIGLGIVLIVLVILILGSYNSFVTQSNAIEAQWKQVEVQYQRRFDLIPNLVDSVKGLMQQEQTVFSDISAARANYTGAKSTDERVQAASQLDGAMSRLLAIFENYPQIKSDQAVLNLMDELSGTENRIAVERRRYNDLVQKYNNSVTTMPGKIFSTMFGFGPHAYFESTAGSENAPKVDL